MAFKVSQATWLAVESARIKEVVLLPRLWRRKWTDATLREELTNLGLDYTEEEVKLLTDELHNQKVVEDVVEAEVGGEVAPDSVKPA